jgi:NAD(P)H-hydrate epimerase
MSYGVKNSADLEALLEKADVIAFGPGLGQSAWSQMLFDVLVADKRPAVWDADALNLLAKQPAMADNRIITPHPGEAGVLLGLPIDQVQADRAAALRALTAKYGGVTVLKGAGTLISGNSGVPYVCTSGNPGMAAPGMGDVLTGVIAALLAQVPGQEQAAVAGVEVHARAGDRAAQGGERGMLASDVLAELRVAVNP